MPRLVQLVVMVSLAGGLSAGAQVRGDATQVLAAARHALGGDQRLSGVRTFTAVGRTQQVRGNNLVPIEFEIVSELPDKYRRTDEVPAQESGPTSLGFSRDQLIQLPVPTAPGLSAGRGPSGLATPEQLEAARTARLVGVKQDFVRFTLGMFAGSFPSYPLTFSYVGTAEAPQGQADVLDVQGAANFALRLFVHRETHLPLMVSWQAPSGRGSQVENRLYYADYRDVDGLHWPFRLRRSAGADTVEETTIDRFRVNAKISPGKFLTK